MKLKLLILLTLASLGVSAQSWVNFGANGIQRKVNGTDTAFRWNGGASGYLYGRSEAYYKTNLVQLNPSSPQSGGISIDGISFDGGLVSKNPGGNFNFTNIFGELLMNLGNGSNGAINTIHKGLKLNFTPTTDATPANILTWDATTKEVNKADNTSSIEIGKLSVGSTSGIEKIETDGYVKAVGFTTGGTANQLLTADGDVVNTNTFIRTTGNETKSGDLDVDGIFTANRIGIDVGSFSDALTVNGNSRFGTSTNANIFLDVQGITGANKIVSQRNAVPEILDIQASHVLLPQIAIGRSPLGQMATFEGTIVDGINFDGVIVTTRTEATATGYHDVFGISSQITDQKIPVSVNDTGLRVAITGDAYSQEPTFAGRLNTQIGLRGRAGFGGTTGGTSGALVDNAIGVMAEIRNETPSVTIDNAYGIKIAPLAANTGTINNLYGIYQEGSTFKNVFEGKTYVNQNDGTPTAVVRNSDLGTGWATYADNVYTTGSPLTVNSGVTVTLPNNAATVINSQLPFGVTSFYNSGTSKITPELNGDSYLVNVRFKARSSSPSGLAKIGIDIGSGSITTEETQSLRNGAATEQIVNLVFDVYSLSTFVANGGLVKFTSVIGNTEIYDIFYKITRTHKAK